MYPTRIARDVAIIAICALIIMFAIPIAWWWQVALFIIAAVVVILFPMLTLLIEPWRVPAEHDDVLLAARMHDWRTIAELRRAIEKRKGIQSPQRVSLLDVMHHTNALVDEGVFEGRERQPRTPTLLSPGSAWEYRRKM